MKKISRNIIIGGLSLLLAGGSVSCNNWLDLQPVNDQTTDRFWESKEEVEAVLFSSYKQLRSCLERFVQWGELRGDALTYVNSSSDDAAKIKQLDILTNNSVAKWDNVYKAIGYANSVLKYGPGVMEKDPTFTRSMLNMYEAEAIYIRSLCYFYLVRTFGYVPLVLEPYIDDQQEFALPSSGEEEVLGRIVSDLEANIAKCKTGYESDDPDTWMNKGRATKWAYHALLADIYLWQGNYQRCISQCEQLINSGKFRLLTKENWFRLFYPGNSDEGIFELQYDYLTDNSYNALYAWFYNNSGNSYYQLSEKNMELFTEYAAVKDVRGLGASYLETGKIWKYAGMFSQSESKSTRNTWERDGRTCSDNNWIFYRYADILLMKAEALIMSGDIQGGYDIIVNEIRTRAGYSALTSPALPAVEYDALKLLLDERQREFVGEGKRWFDILRIAKRNDYKYKDYLLEVLLANVSAKEYETWKAKLSDPNSYYLPIHKDEIDNGRGILNQNPYYRDKE